MAHKTTAFSASIPYVSQFKCRLLHFLEVQLSVNVSRKAVENGLNPWGTAPAWET